jgi:hypothetical protein
MLDSEIIACFLGRVDLTSLSFSDSFTCEHVKKNTTLYTKKQRYIVATISDDEKYSELILKEQYQDRIESSILCEFGYLPTGKYISGGVVYRKYLLENHLITSSNVALLRRRWWTESRKAVRYEKDVFLIFTDGSWRIITGISMSENGFTIDSDEIQESYNSEDIIIWATPIKEVINPEETIVISEEDIINLSPSSDYPPELKFKKDEYFNGRSYDEVNNLQSMLDSTNRRVLELELSQEVLELKVSFLLLHLKPTKPEEVDDQ